MSELEVLSSIYGEHLEVLSDTRFRLTCSPYVGHESHRAYACVLLEFSLPAAYPKEMPLVKIITQKGLDEERVNQFNTQLKQRYPLGNIG